MARSRATVELNSYAFEIHDNRQNLLHAQSRLAGENEFEKQDI